ncbi:hypothetical protein C8J57DRAFT_1576180 [Mycena rebaudengoi]|nr:hypothetical protein C8J57DRAFT_1576180 [Mycena rebaudengoi]
MRQKGAKSSKQVMAGTRRRRTKKARLEAKTECAVSWIWIAEAQVVKEGDSPEINEALRIEWAKARACCMRWREEVDLLEEEMRRVVQFSMWRSEWWKDQVGQKGLDKGAQLEGTRSGDQLFGEVGAASHLDRGGAGPSAIRGSGSIVGGSHEGSSPCRTSGSWRPSWWPGSGDG